mgnify:FL=1
MVIDARQLHNELTAFLESYHIEDADFDARCIMEQVTGKSLEMLFISGIPSELENPIRNMTQRRAFHEPLQYILGEWEFYGMRLFVGKGVLIPRPDTETLVDSVLDWCKNREISHIIDLCTGSGCIAITLKKHLPNVKVSAVEFSQYALDYAKKNADYHHLDIDFIHADVLDKVTQSNFCGNSVDIIVSNPPYLDYDDMASLQTEVKHEPALALAGGEDGLRYYRTITNLWKNILKSGGLLAYEIGETQAHSVSEIMKTHAFRNVRTIQDLAGNDRVILGEKLSEH